MLGVVGRSGLQREFVGGRPMPAQGDKDPETKRNARVGNDSQDALERRRREQRPRASRQPVEGQAPEQGHGGGTRPNQRRHHHHEQPMLHHVGRQKQVRGRVQG